MELSPQYVIGIVVGSILGALVGRWVLIAMMTPFVWWSDWRDKRRRERIAAALANVRAWMKAMGLPILTPAFVKTDDDRVMFHRNALFFSSMQPPLFERWDAASSHGVTVIRGWREARAMCSAQVIEHTGGIEIDFDHFNPDYGIGPAVGHMIEALWPGKTDPFKIQKALRKRGIDA